MEAVVGKNILKFLCKKNQKYERKTGLEPATYSLGSCRSTR
jgi:hypothetical protein